MTYAAAGAHDLYITGIDDAVGAGTVLVGQCALEGNRDDLHILVGMGIKPFAFPDGVVIQHTQRAKMDLLFIVPVAEAKRMMAVQPAEIYVAAFGSRVIRGYHR